MRKHLLTLCLILSLPLSLTAQTWPVGSIQTKAGSRWWWLGSAVDKENLAWSMREYASKGIRTLEITPIYGVQGEESRYIDFLSPKWMETLRFVEETAAKEGIQIDMNFGTGWPFGGPTTPLEESTCKVSWTADTIKVARKGEVTLDIGLKGEDKDWSFLQRVIAYRLDASPRVSVDLTASADGDILRWKPSKGVWLVIAQYCVRTRDDVKRAAPGGEGLVIDHFDPKAVSGYIRKFEDAFRESGVPYPDTFFNDSYEVYQADWTPGIYDEFLKRRGYRLEDYLPELLIGGGPDEARVLHDYRETLGDLLYEYFTCQWVSWAHSHGVRVRNQAHGSPANLIDLYAAVDIPEIEGFGLSEFGIKGLRTDPGKTRVNYSDLSMLKYAPSAAHITGKRLTSAETFTWLTEHFRTSLSQLKPDMDLMFCAGVNRMLFHGTCYSPKDDPWPGWRFYASIDMSPANTIWRDASWFTEYVDRCQRFLQWGEPDNDFLVYLPIHDMWSKRKDGLLMMFEISNMDKNAPEFIEEVLAIDALGYGSDYVSDRYLASAKAVDGRIVTEGGISYKGLIIPEGATLPPATREKVEALRKAGATVIEGADKEALLRACRPEELKTTAGLHWIRRRNPSGHHYFIANLTPSDYSGKVSLGVDFSGALLFDPMTGKVYEAETDGDQIALDLRSGESIILQTFDTPAAFAAATAARAKDPGRILSADGAVDSGRTQPQRSENGRGRSPAARRRPTVAGEGGIDLTGAGWTLAFTEEAPSVGRTYSFANLRTWEGLDDKTAVTMGTGVYSTTFDMTPEQASKAWAIDLGDVRESARVYINGELVGCAWAVPFVLECGDVFKEGRNDLRIEVTNLPANRIAWMDRQGVLWRKFHNINVVDINYKHTTYDGWEPVPSGLASTVILRPVLEK